jgi:hypothetical protein
MIFEIVCSTWSMVEVKTLFETWVKRNDVKCVSLFHLSYLIILMVYLCTQLTSNLQINYFMFDWSIYRLFVLNWAWKHDSLQILLFVRIWFLDMKHRWNKNAVWDVNNKKWRKWWKFVKPFLFNITYGFPVLTNDNKFQI